MSAKWVRSKKWDDQFFPSWAWPAKLLLRAFSSIALAVTLLALVASYGILASIPIGMIAGIPSYLVLFAIVAVAVAVVGGGGVYLTRLITAPFGPRIRFAASLMVFLALAIGTCIVLYSFGRSAQIIEVGPTAYLSPKWKFFADFCQEYRATTLRRLPGMEMSEMEFYAWWPLEVILLAFIANLTIATVRRIEFKFVNLGVLTVHTGIITIAIGSIYYAALKQEGDMRLRVGSEATADGRPAPGDPEAGFFSREQPAIWISQDSRNGWDQRSTPGLPRYNEYNLDPTGALSQDLETRAELLKLDHGRKLDIRIPSPPAPPVPSDGTPAPKPRVDPDIQFRIVGYAPYCTLADRMDVAEALGPGVDPTPVRFIDLIKNSVPTDPAALPPVIGPPPAGSDPMALKPGEKIDGQLPMVPSMPARRIGMPLPDLEIEYTRDMSEERWQALSSPLPAGIQHALLIEVPGLNFKQVFPIAPNQKLEVTPGGYQIEVKQILPKPPFPIITKGYEDAPSSVAIVRVIPPADATGRKQPFERYCYHRFPEIAQDMLDEKNDRGMPKRVAPDGSIKLTYIDAAGIRLFFDERPGGTPGNPSVRLLMRVQTAGVRVFENLSTGSRIPITPNDTLRLSNWYPGIKKLQFPDVVAEADRQREGIGTHKNAALALEVSLPAQAGKPAWSTTVWLPHGEYFPVEAPPEVARRIALPDGRSLTVGFGRRYFAFPGLGFSLADFEMTPFPHSDTPRDYRSDLIVYRTNRPGEAAKPDGFQYSTSMNNPLLLNVPYQAVQERGVVANFLGWIVSLVAPNQYKISQVGWDPNTWFKTKAAADAGQIKKPFVSFTILGVGNNPGIYVVASGAIMMGLGIPWAFYVKPAIQRYKKRKIQAEIAAKLARGESIKPVPASVANPADSDEPRPAPPNDQVSPAPRIKVHANGTVPVKSGDRK